MTLVRIAKDWDWPDLLRQTPGGRGRWEDIQFTLEPVSRCDVLVLLNNRQKEPLSVICPYNRVWALMQEPYISGHSDWIREGHDAFHRVYTHAPLHHPRYRRSQPAVSWHVNRSFDELTQLPPPRKTRDLSWVVGNADELPGHIRRLRLLRHIRQAAPFPIDLYGRAVSAIPDKWDGLASYRYALAIENSQSPDYWTEKLADCFLARTIPLYYGCLNLEDYFPREAFIRIAIDRPQATLEQIRDILRHDNREDRQNALEEARNLVLHRYQLFPTIARWIHEDHEAPASPALLVVPPYRRRPLARGRRILFKIQRTLRKVCFAMEKRPGRSRGASERG